MKRIDLFFLGLLVPLDYLALILAALAAYSLERAPRAARVQREALTQARIYHLSGLGALARNIVMQALGSKRLLSRYDWLYAE